MITSIKKRDGREVPFHIEKIEEAIRKAFVASGNGQREAAKPLAEQVVRELAAIGFVSFRTNQLLKSPPKCGWVKVKVPPKDL